MYLCPKIRATSQPGHATLEMASDIIESLMRHHGLDANKHPFLEPEPATPVKKIRKRKRVMPALDQEADEDPKFAVGDENDNSVNGDDDNKDEAYNDRAGEDERNDTNDARDKERSGGQVVSQYEISRIRISNIAEQEKLKEKLGFLLNTKVMNEKLGIMPTSKVRKLK